jgi:N-acetylneuraminic acid mutarotase
VTQLPAAYAGGGAVIVDNKLHYFGGYNLNRTDTDIHLVLDLANPSAGWTAAARMPKARNHMGYVNLGGKIYAIAGQTGTDEGLVTQRDVQIYDPATNTWSLGAAMPKAASHVSSSTFVMGGRIIVAGGESSHGVSVRDVFAYTPSTNSWVTLTFLPAPRFSGVATAIDGKILFTTGSDQTTTWLGTPA